MWSYATHFGAHIGLTGPEEPPGVGEKNATKLPFRHWIQNWSPGGVRPRTIPLSHGGSPHY